MPKQVIKNYNVKDRDVLEFYPPDTDFPDEETDNLLAVLIVRATTSLSATVFGARG